MHTALGKSDMIRSEDFKFESMKMEFIQEYLLDNLALASKKA